MYIYIYTYDWYLGACMEIGKASSVEQRALPVWGVRQRASQATAISKGSMLELAGRNYHSQTGNSLWKDPRYNLKHNIAI